VGDLYGLSVRVGVQDIAFGDGKMAAGWGSEK
jgi:hypothetical protein